MIVKAKVQGVVLSFPEIKAKSPTDWLTCFTFSEFLSSMSHGFLLQEIKFLE